MTTESFLTQLIRHPDQMIPLSNVKFWDVLMIPGRNRFKSFNRAIPF